MRSWGWRHQVGDGDDGTGWTDEVAVLDPPIAGVESEGDRVDLGQE
ncbi:MAG: hypothetical protein R2710_15575 [Acidimicrobiales bacterium]